MRRRFAYLGMLRRRTLLRLLLASASPLVAFGLLELGLRLGGFRYPPADEPITIWNRVEDRELRLGIGLHQSDERLLWRPRPGATTPWGGDRINAEGFRGPSLAVARTPGVVRVAALGDSTTFGHGVDVDSTFCAQIVDHYAQSGVRVEVLNAGVVGYTVLQGLERYRRDVRPYRPDVVIAAFGAVNEQIPGQNGLGDDERIEGAIVRGQGWSTQLAWWWRSEVRIAHLLAWARERGDEALLEDRKADLQARREWNQAIADSGAPDWPGTRRVGLERYVDALGILAEEVAADGARLVVVSMPRKRSVEKRTPALLEYTAATEAFARDNDLPWIDGRRAFMTALALGGREHVLLRDDFHPSRRGHRILAVKVEEQLNALGLTPAIH